MVSFIQLRDAKPDLWQKAADGWLVEAQHAAHCADEIRARGTGKLDEHWQDKVGQLAGAALANLAKKFEAASYVMRGAVMVLDALAESLAVAQTTLHGAVDDASRRGYPVGDDGSVHMMVGGWLPIPFDIFAIRARIKEALETATQADQKAAAALKRIEAAVGVTDPEKAVNEVQLQASHDQMDILRSDIPFGMSSLANAKWWASLTPEQQRQLQLAEPTVLAGLDGIPDDVKKSLRGDGKYDRMKLVQWALDHSNDNSIDIFDNNCANFVSTALHESGVSYKTGLTLEDNTWGHGLQTGWAWLDAHDYSHSATWTQAGKLHDFLTKNGSQAIPLNEVKPGDVIFFEQGSPNPDIPQGQIHHVAIVTAVTPDGDIKYTQHSDNQCNFSLNGRELHENTVEGQQKIHAVRVNPNWY